MDLKFKNQIYLAAATMNSLLLLLCAVSCAQTELSTEQHTALMNVYNELGE